MHCIAIIFPVFLFFVIVRLILEDMADLDLNKMHILVEFHQEGKCSVLRLKKAVNLEEPIDFASWDTQTSVEVLWNGKTYPGYILQFGGRR